MNGSKDGFSGFYDNKTDVWSKVPEHMMTVCANDNDSKSKNGKNCRGVCDCMGGEYIIDAGEY